MIDGSLAPVSHLRSNFIAAIFGLLWKQLSYCEPPPSPPAFIQTPRYLPAFIGREDAPWRSHKEQMIPPRHMMELSEQWSLGRAPTQRAICHRKTPNLLLLILITNRKSYGSASGASCVILGGARATGICRCCSRILVVGNTEKVWALFWSLRCRWIGTRRANGSLNRKQ